MYCYSRYTERIPEYISSSHPHAYCTDSSIELCTSSQLFLVGDSSPRAADASSLEGSNRPVSGSVGRRQQSVGDFETENLGDNVEGVDDTENRHPAQRS